MVWSTREKRQSNGGSPVMGFLKGFGIGNSRPPFAKRTPAAEVAG
jgi:hypothetical protein